MRYSPARTLPSFMLRLFVRPLSLPLYVSARFATCLYWAIEHTIYRARARHALLLRAATHETGHHFGTWIKLLSRASWHSWVKAAGAERWLDRSEDSASTDILATATVSTTRSYISYC
eukprot:6212709-Pleurochrysis_carterae.AAC.3